jgi:hypothetical protein
MEQGSLTLEQDRVLTETGFEEAWFDSSHSCFLLLKYGQISMWTSNGGIELVHDLGDSHRKKAAKRQDILYAKISLDRGFLVLQYSETSLKVLDLRTPSQQWSLEIKSAYDNRIIEEGLIWSQHGGGSEDLIIVTARGSEMYKISSKRNQCKLSRVLNQGYNYHARFWYEPNHRVLMLASPLNALDSSSSNGFFGFFAPSNKAEEQKKVLLQDLGTLALNGYFFRIDKDNVMPKLELPPPEKTPKWEVGPRVHESDMSLVALYGSVYCIVHMRKAPEYHLEGELHLYRLTTSSATHTHTLSLDYPAPDMPPLGTSLAFSVADNLLVVHCKRLRVSVVFEVTSVKDGSGDYAVENKGSGGRDSKDSIRRQTQQTKKKKRAPTGPLALSPLSPPVSVQQEDPAGKARTPGPGEEYYQQAHEDGVLVSHEQHLLQSKRSSRALQAIDIYDDGEDDARFCRWQMHPPHWLWDKKFRALHVLRPRIGTLLAAMHHRQPSVYADFLLRRGASLRAPRPVYNDLPGEARHRAKLSVTAKLLLMHKVGESLELTRNLTYLQALFVSLCAPYARLHRALGQSQQEDASTEEGTVKRLPHAQSLPPPAPLLPAKPAVSADGSSGQAEQPPSVESPQAEGGGAGNSDDKVASPSTPSPQNTGAEEPLTATRRESLREAFDEEVVGEVGGASPLGLGMSSEEGVQEEAEGDAEEDGEGIMGLISSARDSVINSPAMEGISSLVTEAQGLYTARIQPYTAAVGEFMGVGGGEELESDAHLEPPNSLQLFLPDLSAVTSAQLGEATGAGAEVRRQGQGPEEQTTNSAGLRVSVARDASGMLAVTQTELLSVMWFPLVLINSKHASKDYVAYALTLYLGALHGAGASALPCACILLIRLLSSQRKFLEIARLMQLQYFVDSSEVALTSLEVCDVLQQEDARAYRRQLPTMRTLQQAALDMLWRLEERNTVVRWLCSHGRVSDAMRLCQRRKGKWRRGLSPATVNGCDFYNGALLLVQSRGKGSSSSGGGGGGGGGGEEEGRDCYLLAYPRRLGIYFAVYRFLLSWDHSLLSLSNKGKSKLASQSSFPPGFTDRDELQLRGLMGFPVSEALITRVTGIE